MSGTVPDTSRDEEIARALQLAPESVSDVSAGSTGTMVAMPPVAGAAAPSSAPAAAAAGEVHPAQGTSSPSGLEFAKLRTLVRSFIIGYGIWWVFSVIFRAWWFIFDCAFIFVPVGWLGLKSNNARFVKYFYYYLALDLAFQVLFVFAYQYEISGLAIIMLFIFIALQGAGAWYVRNYSLILAQRFPLPVTTASIPVQSSIA